MIIGLAIVSLKPQIGAVAVAAVVALPRYRWTVLPVAAICLISCAPFLILGTFSDAIVGFLGNLSKYSGQVANLNSSANLAGIINMLDYLFPNFLNQFTSILFLEIAAMAITYFIFSFIPVTNYRSLDTKAAIAKLILFLAALFFFARGILMITFR